MMQLREVLIIILLALSMVPVFGQTPKRPVQAEISGFMTTFLQAPEQEGRWVENYWPGAMIGAHIWVNRFANLHFAGAYAPDISFPVENDRPARTSIADFCMQIQLKTNGSLFAPKAFFAPYIATGFGVNRINTEWGPYLPGTAGIRFQFTPAFGLKAEARYQYALRREVAYDQVTFSAGLVLGFGPPRGSKPINVERDSDGDGIVDQLDKCPAVPGEALFLGCPDTTNPGMLEADQLVGPPLPPGMADSSIVTATMPNTYPELPWPPPATSAKIVLPDSLLGKKRFLPGQVFRLEYLLSEALNDNGYFNKAYYRVPGGFALVTQMEHIDQNGQAKSGKARWEAAELAGTQFSLPAYTEALNKSRPGQYRVMVFIIADQNAPEHIEQAERLEAFDWLFRELVQARATGSLEEAGDQFCLALVYEFQRSPGKGTQLVLPGSLGAEEHLRASGIWEALQ